MPIKIKITLSDSKLNSQALSQREEECLFYLLRGKTVKSIAKILNLSPRTVEDHITSIKQKWNSNNKEDIFEKANQYGYLKVIPLTQFKNNLNNNIYLACFTCCSTVFSKNSYYCNSHLISNL